MSKEMNKTNSKEDMKNSGGRRIVPGFVDMDIRGINNDRRHEAK